MQLLVIKFPKICLKHTYVFAFEYIIMYICSKDWLKTIVCPCNEHYIYIMEL